MKSLIYFDYAAATPVDERVITAMQPYWSEQFYNPSATYLPARAVSDALLMAREQVGHWLGARPSEIIFTAGGTEANNLAIHGIMQQYPEGNIVVSSIEHEAVLAPAHRYECREVSVKPDGTVDLSALENAIDDKTVLVSIMYANNEIGTIQPLKDIAEIIDQKRSVRINRSRHLIPDFRHPTSDILPLYFHTDACQAANYLDLHASRLGVDMMTLNGGKIYGPKQSGALYVGSRVSLQPVILGGGQERNLRSGTENVAGSIGFAAAIDIAQNLRNDESARLQNLRQLFMKHLGEILPKAVVNGSQKKRLPNNMHVTFPEYDNERLLIELENSGFLAAAGSACSASDEEPSHVLRAIGLSDSEAQSSLRFTMGRTTTEPHIKTLVSALKAITH